MNETLHFMESGSGNKTLIFLHYFGGSSRTWQPVMESLSSLFTCVAVDLPGFGDSAPVEGGASIEAVCDRVQRVLAGRKDYVLVGHSMGGKVALELASRMPEGLLQLILIAPSPPTPEPMKEADRKNLADAYGHPQKLRAIIDSISAQALPETRIEQLLRDYARIDRQAWNDWLNIGSKEDITGQVKNFRLPMTVISGDADPGLSIKTLQPVFQPLFPQARFLEVAGASHLLPVENPGALAELIAGIAL